MDAFDRNTILRHSTPGPRYTSYPPATAFHEGYGPDELAQSLFVASLAEEPLSVYVHIPFCQKRCGFCGCNVIVTRKQEPAFTYLDALDVEIALIASGLGQRRRAAQLHLGGGTPTFLAEAELTRLWRSLTEAFDFDPQGELAIEIDPRVTTPGQLELLRGFGFSRVSLGVQDLDESVQEHIGRIQPASMVRQQTELCRALGYQSVNFDLLYGLPGQSPDTLARTLDGVLEMRPDRIAVYGFAYMPARFAHQRALDPSAVPSNDERIDLQLLTYRRLTEGGYRPIGFDHFALPGDELCTAVDEQRLRRNFMGYTTWPASDLIGLGVSSIGEVQGSFSQNAHKLSRYLEALSRGVLPVERGYQKDAEDELRGEVIERLLCLMHVDLAQVARRHGRSIEAFSAELEELRPFESDGLLVLHGSSVRLTEMGRLVGRTVARVFDHHLRAARVTSP
jgi:oxygen-independent coproporphyrinogen III oxidase